MIFFFLLALLAVLLSAQVQLSEFRLLTGRYNYRLQATQWMTWIAGLLSLLAAICDITVSGLNCIVFIEIVLCGLTYAISEWLLARWSPKQLTLTVAWRLLVILMLATAVAFWGQQSLLPFLSIGLYFRNSPFGVVHGKPFWLVHWNWNESWSGNENRSGNRAGRLFLVTDYGVQPDTGRDVLEPVQKLIDEVGKLGGGTIFFPRGQYLFNMSGKRQFLQINHSHVTLEGERDARGNLLTELVNCGPTTEGKRNPWLSPFFITTGEALQPSNQFWGLDFKNPSGMKTESSSLSDPGSDGVLLSPPFASKVTKEALAGTSILTVEDSSEIGKYILLGMYNTTPDGNLIKELLGVDDLRPEWTTARRAGPEKAPSFQWLAEVKQVVDGNTIELCRPLQRDCLMKYEPAIFNVDMLEDIHIRHLHICSRWNGLFRHHGFPLYYSVAQAQEMDYGWNAINMKRVAHSTVEDVLLKDFTNPLYVQDSREVTVEDIGIVGYDGHQGIKVYCHTCDCMFRRIDFYNYFADMMGGEGNAYGNVFSDICYHSPVFKPVDFDFHGFSEGPMSPPAYNMFERVRGFRYIKGAGAVYMQPASGVGNVWRDVAFDGGKKGEQPFYASSYRVKSGLEKYVTAAGYTLVMMMKRKQYSFAFVKKTFAEKLKSIVRMSVPQKEHGQFFSPLQPPYIG
jgi:hypothetical protein